MATTIESKLLYKNYYQEDNRITDEGCRMLLKGDWGRLKSLEPPTRYYYNPYHHVDSNIISEEGIKYLKAFKHINRSKLLSS